MLQQLKAVIFYYKIIIIYYKIIYLISNTQVLLQTYYFKLFNMKKFIP
jgi:hypothetical protein